MLKEKFRELFNLSLQHGQNINLMLETLSGETGLSISLNTDFKKGLQSDQVISQMREEYGAHVLPLKQLTTLFQLIKECLQDTMLQILIIASIVSTIINILEEGASTGWMEGTTILFAVILVVTITAGNNHIKQKQFQKLQGKLDEQWCEVIRFGETRHINSQELVVGDLMLIHIGDILTVDGILIAGSEVKIDESSLTGESQEFNKVPFSQLNNKPNASSLLLSCTKVVDGSGTILILQVGENTIQAQMSQLLQQETLPTPLQVKLEGLAGDIGKFGTAAAVLTFLILITRYYIDCIRGSEQFTSIETLQNLADSFMIAITIIVVAVPEGLPLAVTITLAYSVNKMKDEQNLVKVLDSCEIMGRANNICTDKTGTLTQNSMSVVELWLENKLHDNYSIYNQDNFSKTTIELLGKSICYNTEANPTKSKITGLFEQIGNKSECALIQMADIFGFYYEKFRPSDQIIRAIPFNSKRKKMITVVKEKDKFFVFVKGASENIVEDSSQYISTDGEITDLTSAYKAIIRRDIIDKLAAYKELEIMDEEQLKRISEEELSTNLILLAIVGIKDPLRISVPDAIIQCQKSGILVRMITGDNILTAETIAKECGILDKNFERTEDSLKIMEGRRFREIVGGIETVRVKKKEIQKIKNIDNFKQIAKELRVLARASPEDKYILVCGLLELDNVVAVTGDGTNDAPALRKADVGFAMGIAGTSVAKEAADIILLDDNFSSIITACKWGRNIYNCIRKFIQFQLTVNVVALFMSVLGAIATKQAPLNAIEMLWANLIMDTFASLALATEPPSEEVLERLPFKRNENIVNAIMWRTIIGQSIYQIFALCLVLFVLPHTMDLSLPSDFKHAEDYPDDIVKLSMFFQAFILMQVFHSVTCRKLDEKSLNPLSNWFNNPLFWIIQGIILVVQFLLISFGGRFIEAVPLTFKQHMVCLVFGIFGMTVGILVRLIPKEIFENIKVFHKHHLQLEDDEQDENAANNSINTQFSSAEIELAQS